MSETWVLNELVNGISLTTTMVSFTSNNTAFTWINARKGYIAYSNSEEWDDANMVYDTASWTNSAYRTITFDTAPTGDLLTWLQANGTKQAADPTFSFTHRYKSDNLIGTGAYKFRPYTLTQQPTPDEPTDDPLAGTWTFNETLNLSAELMPEEVIVELGWVDLPITADDGTEYFGLLFGSLNGELNEFTSLLYGETEVYNGVWGKESDRTITIGALLEEVKNGQALLEFLQNNATKKV